MDVRTVERVLDVEVDSRDQAAIACPRCQFVKQVDAPRITSADNRIKVRCRCGHVFRCRLNFRRHFRKPVRLAGEYVNLKTGKRGDMLIEDLSMGGVGFTRFSPAPVGEGDPVEVRFRLSLKSGKEIAKRARARFVKGEFVGVEFNETYLHGKDLRAFLMEGRTGAALSEPGALF